MAAWQSLWILPVLSRAPSTLRFALEKLVGETRERTQVGPATADIRGDGNWGAVAGHLTMMWHRKTQGLARRNRALEAFIRRFTSTERVAVFVWCWIVIAAVAATVFLAFYQATWMHRGGIGSTGLFAALIGFGCALWWTIRVRRMRCVLALLGSLIPLSIWSWILYCATIGQDVFPSAR